MEDIEKWIDNLFENTIPDAGVGVGFVDGDITIVYKK